MGLHHQPLAFAGSALFRRKARARTVPSPSGVWHSLVPLSALPVTGFVGAVPPASGFGRFPPCAGERKRSQTLNFTGGNRSWLTPNPLLKSASVASRLRFWPNGTDGRTRHNVTFSRLYKDGDEWKNTQSFSRNDLLLLAKVADQAHSRIFELQQEEEPQAES